MQNSVHGNKFLLIFLILDNDIVIHIPQVHILIIEICTNSGNIIFFTLVYTTINNMPNTEIKFQFDNGDDYLLLKNKIELCLSNFKLNYRIFSRLPIMTFLLGFGMLFIVVYTNFKNIKMKNLMERGPSHGVSP